MPERSEEHGGGFAGGRRLGSHLNRLLGDAAAYAQSRAGAQPAREGGAENAIEFRSVTTTIGGRRALSDVNLEIPAGSLTAVVGAVGLAKDALLEHVLGNRVPEYGDVRVLGRSILDLTEEDLLTRALQVGVVLRDGGLLGSMSIYDNVALLLRNGGAGLTGEEIAATVERQLEALGLSDHAERLPGELGRAQRKRAGLARALAMEPPVVLFDEPETGLDRVMTDLFGELIAHIHAQRGGTWLIVTTDVELARSIAAELVLMHRGRVLATGSREELGASENPYVRALLAENTPRRGMRSPPGDD